MPARQPEIFGLFDIKFVVLPRFLLTLGLTSAGAAASVAAPLAASGVAGTAAAADSSGGYRETEHVRDYYDSARI